jgi:hypothetical protein
VQLGGGANPVQGSFVSVRRNTDGSFGEADWVDLNYTGLSPLFNVTSSNSVHGNNVVGIVIGLDTFSSQATINSSFQLSNVISGNGITLVGANNNFISMNYIGTDTTGSPPRRLSWALPSTRMPLAPFIISSFEGSTEYLTDQVDAMYLHYLNRPADAGGQKYWVGTLLAGGTLEQVAAGLASSDEFFVDQGSTNRGYVIGLYADVLGRVASTPEVDAWVAQLDAGATRLSVATAFLISQEYRKDLVQADYNTFLKHAADPDGLAYWVGKLNAGATDQQILAGIFGSPEGYKLWS